MEPIKLGEKLKGGEQRDAIHIAVLPVIVDEEYMCAGEQAKLAYGTTNTVRRAMPDYGGYHGLGVIDPFLKDNVRRGDKVWLFLYPQTITGLRHDWTHPAIDNPPKPSSEAERWLRDFADRWNFDYDDMVSAAIDGEDSVITARGIDLHGSGELGEDLSLFWQHVSELTKKTFTEEHKAKVIWSCSC